MDEALAAAEASVLHTGDGRQSGAVAQVVRRLRSQQKRSPAARPGVRQQGLTSTAHTEQQGQQEGPPSQPSQAAAAARAAAAGAGQSGGGTLKASAMSGAADADLAAWTQKAEPAPGGIRRVLCWHEITRIATGTPDQTAGTVLSDVMHCV